MYRAEQLLIKVAIIIIILDFHPFPKRGATPLRKR